MTIIEERTPPNTELDPSWRGRFDDVASHSSAVGGVSTAGNDHECARSSTVGGPDVFDHLHRTLDLLKTDGAHKLGFVAIHDRDGHKASPSDTPPHRFLYFDERVTEWDKKGVQTGLMAKVRTMHHPTPEGLEFEHLVRKVILERKTLGLDNPFGSLKEVSDYRLLKFGKLMRKFSVDELAQVYANVLGLPLGSGIDKADLLPMSLFGSNRPPKPEEIEIRGDNANPCWNNALEIVAREHGDYGSDAIQRLHYHLGGIAAPSLANPRSARGESELNNTADFLSFIRGMLEYDEIMSTKPAARRVIAAKMITQTFLGRLKPYRSQLHEQYESLPQPHMA